MLFRLVTPRKSIRNCIKPTRFVFHCEIKTKQLANPLMLRHGGKALITHDLEGIMIRANYELPAPKIRTPMTNSLDKVDQFMFISGKLQVTSCKWPAVKGQWSFALVENGTKSCAGGISINYERMREIRKV